MRTWPLALALLLAGCRSPVASALGPETGPPEDPGRVGTGIHAWPGLESAWHGATHRTDVLWPLATVRAAESGGVPAPDSVFPLGLHASSPEGTRWGFRPLFDVESRTGEKGPVEDVDLLFPLLKWRTAPGEGRFEIRPILFTGHRGDASHFTLAPLLFTRDDPGGESWFHVAPLWFSGRGEDSAWTLVPPVWYRRDAGEVHDLHVWPFWGKREKGTYRKDWVLFPFFGHAEDPERDLVEWDAFFPLLHYGDAKDRSSIRALPLLWHEATPESATTVAFPFWWSIRDGDASFEALFPLYMHRSRKEFDRRFYLLNALVTTRDRKESSVDVLWPLVRGASGPDSWSFRLFPVLWLDRDGKRGTARTHLWPLFGVEETSKDATDAEGRPAKEVVAREFSTLYPFFVYGEGEGRWSLDAPLPLGRFESGEERWQVRVFPVLDVKRRKDVREGSLLLHLARWRSREPEEGKEGDGGGAGRAGESEFRVLWRLFERTRGPERSLTALNPLFRHESNPRGDDHWAVLFGLLARTREGETTRWRFLWFL